MPDTCEHAVARSDQHLREGYVMSWLKQDPLLRRDDEKHIYWYGDHPFPVSTTGILQAGKGESAIAALEATKHEWAPRGTAVHRSLELFLKLRFHPDPIERELASIDWALEAPVLDQYKEFIDPLIRHPLWRHVEVYASEFMLCDLELDFAGTFDGAYRLPDKGQGVSCNTLFDLKTQRNKRPYSVAAQLGCYMHMARHQGIDFDQGVAIWARPGETSIQSYTPGECEAAWQKAWLNYLESKEETRKTCH